MSATTPDRETHGNSSTPSTTTAATPHRETQADQNVSGTRDEYHAECEFEFEGGPDLETLASQCQKNPGHTNFIPIQEFLKEENGYLDPEHIDDVRAVADRTVRVVVGKVSADRPDVYPGTSTPFPFSRYRGLKCRMYGTGLINPMLPKTHTTISGTCPCISCRTSQQPEMEHYEINVFTAAHVVYDDVEAMETVVELYYDSEDREGVKYLYGNSARRGENRDFSIVRCVTHDGDLIKRLCYVKRRWSIKPRDIPSNNKALIVSHPHGLSKRVSVGNFKQFSIDSRNSINAGVFTIYQPVTGSPFVPHEPVPGAVEIPVSSRFSYMYHYYKLPSGSNVIISNCHESWGKIKDSYITPPPGTQIQLPGGERVDWPDNAEMHWPINYLFQFGYDTSTCPGSSGAPVFCLGEEGENKLIWKYCHCGAAGDTNTSSDGFPLARCVKRSDHSPLLEASKLNIMCCVLGDR